MNRNRPELEWWKQSVVYQIYPRSYRDTTGNGIGDLPGITERLEYLSDTLGVDAIWLSPFYPSPMADFGYDVADYVDVDPLFGTLDDFDRLVDQAHRRGLRVIIDWVPNHSSDRHPWFVESRASLGNARRDWYVWRDPKPDGSPPNNWQSVFGGSAWEFDERTGQFYLHSFLKEQPDLNWRNPAVEEAMFDTLRFWLDRGVDGFRIDVAHSIMKDPNLTDNPPAPATGAGVFKTMGEYDDWDHVHDKGHPDVHDVFRRLRSVLDAYDGNRFTIGEIHIFDWDEWATYYGNGDELHMPFNFSLIWATWNAAEIRRRIEGLEAAIPAVAWPNYVLGNHDEMRLASRYGPENAESAAVLLLTLRGQPTIYYGDELGLRETPIPADRRQDPWGVRVSGMSRDGCRTPMPWTPDPGHGFTGGSIEPWLPFGDDADVCNVATELADERSTLSLYRRMLRLRRSRPSLVTGDFAFLDGVPEDVLSFIRTRGDERTLVLVNFAGEERPVELDPGTTLLLSTDSNRDTLGSGKVTLSANEAIVADRRVT